MVAASTGRTDAPLPNGDDQHRQQIDEREVRQRQVRAQQPQRQRDQGDHQRSQTVAYHIWFHNFYCNANHIRREDQFQHFARFDGE
ncbi:MAG: hypothetical protein U0521_03020 [Anaerolineae bacterium]